jgi:nitroreductase
MDAVEALMTRRSVRGFTADPVTDEELEVVLRAAMAAPSASNERPWRFVTIREPGAIARLARTTPFTAPLKTAPVAIVVCADRSATKYPGFWVIDCSAAIENALIAAHATGLGGVWMGVHPFRPFAGAVRRAIGAPRHVAPHSLIALGHPARIPAPVDRYETAWLHEETW